MIGLGICRHPSKIECFLDNPVSFLRRRCTRREVSSVIKNEIRDGITLHLTLLRSSDQSSHVHSAFNLENKKRKNSQDFFSILSPPILYHIADFTGYSYGHSLQNLKDYLSLS